MEAYFELEEVALMDEVNANLKDRSLVRILVHLVCRVSETLALRVENGKISCLEHLDWHKNLLKKEKEPDES
jgi:hypothetical protein